MMMIIQVIGVLDNVDTYAMKMGLHIIFSL